MEDEWNMHMGHFRYLMFIHVSG